MTTRHTKILEEVAKRQRVEVTTLSDMLGVSQVTIRKDLERLENRGLIRREHGFACLDAEDETGRRMAYKCDIKRRIARAAAEMVEEGETILMESGSCCAFLAEELVTTKRDITIVTNSVFIANYVRQAPYVKIILLGGTFQPDSQVTVGPMTRRCGEIFFSDKFFVGVDGFSPNFGFTGKDHMRVQTIIDLQEYARQIIVLTDSEKFQRPGVLGMARMDKVTDVYTDEGIPKDTEKVLEEHNVTVHKVTLHDDEDIVDET